MRTMLIAAVAASLTIAAAGVSTAADQSTGMMNGVGHGMGMSKARCSPGDPNVLVDKTSKTYKMDTSAPAPGKSSSTAAVPPSMTGGTPMKSSRVSMCKSEADSMGAHKAGAMTMKPKS